MSEYVSYEPPEREYADTMLAFNDFQLASTWGVQIEPDSLGPVNHIVTLMRGAQRVKSVLARVPVGATVKLERGVVPVGPVAIAYPGNLWSSPWQQADHGWHVAINERTALTVADTEMCTPYVAPPVPLRRRLRSWATKRARSAVDGTAGRLGYHRECECERGGDR